VEREQDLFLGQSKIITKLEEIAKAVSFTVRNVLLLEIGGGGGYEKKRGFL
jgi:hypothetical protein